MARRSFPPADVRWHVEQDGPILVVDDDENMLECVQMMLRYDGYEVVGAPHGSSALELAAALAPRLILLDLWMPFMTGAEFIAAYRRMPGPHAPIVIVSAGHDLPYGDTPAGVVAALPKPFELEELLAIVRRYVPGAPPATNGG